ncbi:hypothetical protein APHAL10511_002345 [Amanita phalloides]|nr:hypothetical protein APHAL10511_002345 [Amanita phalloides]
MTTATLRSLYGRATRAFLHRDISLTHSLLQSAFSIIQAPSTRPDALVEQRCKWDILRITFETIIYSSPPSKQSTLPEDLKQVLLESPRVLLNLMYTRSLKLFTPPDGTPRRAVHSAAFLPPQVCITLVYSSIKLDCYDSAQSIIEEWLARRDPLSPPDSVLSSEGDKYEKVMELYCLHILPNLEQWDYAREFLDHETELAEVVREKFKSNLSALHVQALAARKTQQPRDVPRPPSPRPASPTPSTSSSSSLSTTSTHTVKPSNVRGRRNPLSSISSLAAASASTCSLSSDTTATPHGVSSPRNRNANGHGNHLLYDPDFRARSSSTTNRSSSTGSHPSSSSWSSSPFVHSQAVDPPDSSTYAMVKSMVTSYFTPPKLSTLLILFVLFPMISFILRFRHKRRRAIVSGGASNAELVRKRLRQISAGDELTLRKLWGEIVRIVMDTAKMAGSGLV